LRESVREMEIDRCSISTVIRRVRFTADGICTGFLLVMRNDALCHAGSATASIAD
jgi:hypothetical protein